MCCTQSNKKIFALQALKFVDLHKNEFGLLRIKRLPVSGAFHTVLMDSAKPLLKKALMDINIKSPLIHVHSNVDGNRYKGPEHIRKQLLKQVNKIMLYNQKLSLI